MREASFFWKRDRLGAIEIAPLLDVAERIEFLSYINRAPKDIQCLFKFAPASEPIVRYTSILPHVLPKCVVIQ